MKKKRLILILTALLSVLPSMTWAQTVEQQLVVWQKNGDKVCYDLAELPETSFENGLLIITTSKTTEKYQLANILRYTYEGVNTAVDLLPNVRSVSVNKEGDVITFRNLKAGTTVSICAANGTLVEQQTASKGQPLTLSISQRPAGVYLVKAGSQTIKLLKQ